MERYAEMTRQCFSALSSQQRAEYKKIVGSDELILVEHHSRWRVVQNSFIAVFGLISISNYLGIDRFAVAEYAISSLSFFFRDNRTVALGRMLSYSSTFLDVGTKEVLNDRLSLAINAIFICSLFSFLIRVQAVRKLHLSRALANIIVSAPREDLDKYIEYQLLMKNAGVSGTKRGPASHVRFPSRQNQEKCDALAKHFYEALSPLQKEECKKVLRENDLLSPDVMAEKFINLTRLSTVQIPLITLGMVLLKRFALMKENEQLTDTELVFISVLIYISLMTIICLPITAIRALDLKYPTASMVKHRALADFIATNPSVDIKVFIDQFLPQLR